MDYQEYKLTVQEYLEIILISLGISIVISYLFYMSVWGMLWYPAVLLGVYKKYKQSKMEKRFLQLKEEFVSGIQILNMSVQAGLSIENAWKEVEKEMLLIHGKESLFYKEVLEFNHQIRLNIPVEKILMDFAYRTQIDDILSFAEVFDYGKRTGGNWKKIISTSVYRMSEKQDVLKEIEVMVAEKKMEQQVMNVMPLGIILFLLFFSYDYMQALYHNLIGVISMSLCLLAYVFSLWLSDKILQIKV